MWLQLTFKLRDAAHKIKFKNLSYKNQPHSYKIRLENIAKLELISENKKSQIIPDVITQAQ